MSKIDPFELTSSEVKPEEDIYFSEEEKQRHIFYMDIAEKFATLSKDSRLKVGSVLVSFDYSNIISCGVNGWEIGGQNIPDSLEEGNAIHSEINCMLKVENKSIYKNSNLYVTHIPCSRCSRCIVNFGVIKNVIFKHEYKNMKGLDILRNCKINVLKIKDEKVFRL